MTHNKIILLYVPYPSEAEARTAAKLLLEKKLIACANIFPIKSIYQWQQSIKEEQEYILLAKTGLEQEITVRQEIEKNHSYKVPAILSWPVLANKAFFEFITHN